MSAGPAPGEIIIATGSPGTTRSNMKTMTATPASVSSAIATRLATTESNINGPSLTASMAAAPGAAADRFDDTLGLRDQGCRLQGPGLVGDHFQIGFVEDRLLVLQQGQNVALLGDIAVDLLPAFDALLLVLLTPKRADHGVEIIRMPTRVRRLREHRVTGRGARIADRVAPIVERRRRQFVRHAQLEVLGDFVDLDVGVDADIAPHANDGLDHFVVFRLEAARRLDGELDRLVLRIAAGGEKLGRQRRGVRHLDRGIVGLVVPALQRIDGNAVAAQQLFDDRCLVDRMAHRETDVLVVHHAAVGDEDHADIRNRLALALQTRLVLETIILLIRDLERHVRLAALDFGHAAGRVWHELEDHGLERGLADPVFRIGLEAEIGVALVGVDHIGTGADRLLLEALRADLLEIGLGQDVAGKEGHPLEQVGHELLDVGGDAFAVDVEVVDAGPHERDRIAAIGLGLAFDRPNDIFRRKRRAVVPDHALAHVHPDFGLVVVPAPAGEQARLESQIGLLAHILIEDRAVDPLNGRVDRGRPDLRIERRKVNVVGDVERRADGRTRKALRNQQRANETAAGGEGLTTREIEHVLKLPNRPLRRGAQRARLYALVHS